MTTLIWAMSSAGGSRLFDRTLIAQCQAEDVALISADDAADSYGVRRIW